MHVPDEKLPNLMRSADVVACTPGHPPRPTTVLQAMACAVAVVAQPVGVLTEAIVDNVTGVLLSPERPGAVVAALRAPWRKAFSALSVYFQCALSVRVWVRQAVAVSIGRLDRSGCHRTSCSLRDYREAIGGRHTLTSVQTFGKPAVTRGMTHAAEAAPPSAGCVGGPPQSAIHVDLYPAPHAPSATVGRGGYSPAVLHYEQFRTSEPDSARQFFAGAYTPGWRLTGLARGSLVTHRRCEAGWITIDDVLIQGRVSCQISPADPIVVIQPRAGSLTVKGGALPTRDCPVLVAHGMSCVLQVSAARFDVVTIGADALHKVAAYLHAPVSQQIRFLSSRPRSRAAIRAWHRALDYATAALASADTAQQPLTVATIAPLLGGVLLECYPSTVTEPDLVNSPALPGVLKDAVSFIHCHAAGDIGVNDVASAVHLTPRAVQYLFRRQLATTPTEYMRRVRLHRAHQELVAGSRSSTTVTEIALRWGFAHTGRFAAIYRQAYGQSPHTTLRQ